jgi:Sensors of blue-light using FAD
MRATLHHLIYASRASATFREHDIPAILTTARVNNASVEVTGILLYIEGSFFQILEGPKEAVEKLFDRIHVDSRHALVTRIISEPIAHRSFGDWTMGYSSLGLTEVGDLVGENDFFSDASCVSNLGPGRAKKLLKAFKGGSWRIDRTGALRAVGN